MQVSIRTNGAAAMRARCQRVNVIMPVTRKAMRIVCAASDPSESPNAEDASSPQFQQDSRKRLEPLRKINSERVKNAMAVFGAIKAAVEEEAKLRKDILNEVAKVVKEDLSATCKHKQAPFNRPADGSEDDGDDDLLDGEPEGPAKDAKI